MRSVIRVLIGLTVLAAGAAPLFVPAFLGLLGLTVLGSEWRTGRLDWPQGLDSWPALAGFGACAWMMIGSLWALMPGDALGHPIIFAGYLAVVISLLSWFGRLPHGERVAMLAPVVIGGCLALAFLFVEVSASGMLTNRILSALSGVTDVAHGGISISKGGDATVSGFFYNRNMAATVMLLPAVLLACSLVLDRGRRRWLVMLLLTTSAIALAFSDSSTALLGFLAALVVYPLARRMPQGTLRVMTSIFVVLMVLAPAIAALPDRLGLGAANWLPASARDRVGIWRWNAGVVTQNPLLGIGLHGTQTLNDTWMADHGEPVEPMGQPRPARHPHNGFLEIWSELGAIGMLVCLAFGLFLFSQVQDMQARAQPYAIGFAAASMGIAATGWSLWQPWLLAAFSVGLLFLVWGSMTLGGTEKHS